MDYHNKTKAQLIAILDQRTAQVRVLESEVNQSASDADRSERDAQRYKKNWQECEERLKAVRVAVITELRVRHDAEVDGETEYFNGQYVSKVEVTPEMRLLRHLHTLANMDAPF